MLTVLTLSVIFSLTGCGNSRTETMREEQSMEGTDAITGYAGKSGETLQAETNIVLTEEIMELEEGFSAVRYDGDYGFDKFLSEGGASSDGEVAGFLRRTNWLQYLT